MGGIRTQTVWLVDVIGARGGIRTHTRNHITSHLLHCWRKADELNVKRVSVALIAFEASPSPAEFAFPDVI